MGQGSKEGGISVSQALVRLAKEISQNTEGISRPFGVAKAPQKGQSSQRAYSLLRSRELPGDSHGQVTAALC